MYIAIANSILSSSNGGGTPLPITERYYVQDCVGYTGNFISNDYPIGTFIADDRVTFLNGVDGFGVIQYVITMPSSGIDIVGTGVNNGDCFDNTLNLFANIVAPIGNPNITLNYILEPLNSSFVSTDEEYMFGWGYYYEIYYEYINEDGDPSSGNILFSSTGVLDNYNIAVDEQFQIYQDFYVLDGNLTSFNASGYSNNPSIVNTNSFTQNECSYPYFMRTSGSQSGSTFFINYTSDC
jgi:hypothetical protein